MILRSSFFESLLPLLATIVDNVFRGTIHRQKGSDRPTVSCHIRMCRGREKLVTFSQNTHLATIPDCQPSNSLNWWQIILDSLLGISIQDPQQPLFSSARKAAPSDKIDLLELPSYQFLTCARFLCK